MISVIAHAGDGNTHPLIVYDPADAAMAERAHLAFGEIMDLAVGLGGTITGEHGVGRLKRPWLAGYLGPEVMELNQRIKQRAGPAGHPESRRGDLALARRGCVVVRLRRRVAVQTRTLASWGGVDTVLDLSYE